MPCLGRSVQPGDFQFGRALTDHAEGGRGAARKIEPSATHKGTTIIDPDDDRTAAFRIGDAQPRSEGQGPTSTSIAMGIKRFSGRCPTTM